MHYSISDYLWKARVDRVSSRAAENTAEAAEYVWRQVNTRPEVIQREAHDEVSGHHTCRRTAWTRPAVEPLLPVTVTFPVERSTPAPWTLKPAYFQGKK